MPEFGFESLAIVLLAGSLLLVLSVLASRISSKFGVPSLLLFLGIGMLAGTDGPGGIEFDNYHLAFAVGCVCLALILFDGGIRTSWESVRPILGWGISLSVLGTIITAVLTAGFAHYILNISWLDGFLLGAIVSSTDVAAVFGILRARNIGLRSSLKQLLEFEAGSNDPTSIFLTVSVIVFTVAEQTRASGFILSFVQEAGLGFAGGWLGGRLSRWIINTIGIEYEGLYSVLTLGLSLLVFAFTTAIHGSGFLAAYVMGMILGNSDLLHKGSIVRFQDGVAWISQILVFLTLGLLVAPSQVIALWREGIVLSLFLMLLARPIAVFICMAGSPFSWNERFFVSWVGLRGAAPIILATLPLSVGYPSAQFYFNLVFFVVVLSVITQGISIPWMAAKLGVSIPMTEEPEEQLPSGLLPEGFISVEFEVVENSQADRQRIVQLHLPSGVLLTSVKRDGRYLVPRGDTMLAAGDRVWGFARPSNLEFLRRLFGQSSPA